MLGGHALTVAVSRDEGSPASVLVKRVTSLKDIQGASYSDIAAQIFVRVGRAMGCYARAFFSRVREGGSELGL